MRDTAGISRREAIRRVGILMGGMISAPALAGVLSGCQPSTSETWAPQAFSAEQNEMVATISEIIIPETETPGARATRVNRFIDQMLAEWYLPEERRHFLAGLAEVNARSRKKYNQSFLACSPEEQAALVRTLDVEAHTPPMPKADEGAVGDAEALEAEDRDVEGATRVQASEPEAALDSTAASSGSAVAEAAPEQAAPPFFRTMKELTLLGYYSSEIGVSQALPYNNDIIPGRYVGCVPLEETKGQPGVGGY